MSKWKSIDEQEIYSSSITDSGCYAIYMTNINFLNPGPQKPRYKLIYIGTAKNLSKRLRGHPVMIRKNGYCNIRRAKIRIIKNTQERLSLEIKLIKRLKPILNKVHNVI